MFGVKQKQHTILSRYARDESGRVFIDIAAGSMREIYEDYDKTAPYHRKDLDKDLVDYIDDCVREIGDEPFVLRFSLTTSPEEGAYERLSASLRNYFQYMIALEEGMIRKMFRASASLMGLGLLLMIASLLAHQHVAGDVLWGSVLAEGLTVAAWVSMWESLAGLLLNWGTHRRAIKRFQRISEAQLMLVAAEG